MKIKQYIPFNSTYKKIYPFSTCNRYKKKSLRIFFPLVPSLVGSMCILRLQYGSTPRLYWAAKIQKTKCARCPTTLSHPSVAVFCLSYHDTNKVSKAAQRNFQPLHLRAMRCMNFPSEFVEICENFKTCKNAVIC